MTVDKVVPADELATEDAGAAPPATPTQKRTGRRLLSSLVRDPVALLCVLYLLALAVASVFAGSLAPHDPTVAVLGDRLKPPAWAEGGSAEHLLGADALGRDVLSRMFFGGQVSLTIAFGVVLVSGMAGTALGLYAGYRGGWRDSAIMRLVDAQLAFPGLLLVIAVVSALGASVTVIIVVLAIYGWMIYARLVRSLVLQLREELFVTAAELSGVSPTRIALRHLLPNIMPALITQAMLELARIILVESSLSYLGLGIQPPDASWGLMVAENQSYLATAWWTVFFPGLAISLTVLALNQAATWLRTATDSSIHAASSSRHERRLKRDAVRARDEAVRAGRGDRFAGDGPVPLLALDDVSVEFGTEEEPLPVVQHVSLEIRPGSFMGLVGESGSGKTITSMSILDLLPASGRRTGGAIYWKGQQLTTKELKKLRGREITMVFQDPMTSLNALVSVGTQLTEVLRKHRGMSRSEAREEALGLLRAVGIAEPERTMRQLPSALSGGMRQRIMIAIALAPRPELIIADEPTTALDVTIQAQILELLQDLQARFGVAVLLITHDLGVVARVCDSVTVMYGGRIVERGRVQDVFRRPAHPYTAGLLRATPRADERAETLQPIVGTPPTAVELRQPGCAFAARCPHVAQACAERPELVVVGDGRESACWRPEERTR